MITFGKYAWDCPKCKGWTRVKGIGKKVRKCRQCGYKALIETAHVEHYYLVSEIVSAEEIKKGQNEKK